ncbi:MAG: SRPBCC family protein [Planctomycetota bacterium JB042]
MKKFSLVLLGLIAVFLVGFLGLGLASESIEYRNEIVIDRPPEEVWAVFSDPDRAKSWMTGLERIENLSGEHLQVGSRWKLVFLEGGEEIEVLETVTAVEPNRRFAFDLDAEPMLGHTEVRFEPEGEGTRLVATNEMRAKGLIWRAVFRLSRTMFQARSQEQYALLKARIEEGS